MDDLKSILEKLERGEIRADEAQRLISSASIANLSHTRIDLDRRARTGAGEVIFGAGKTPGQICEISKKLLECGEDVLATRLSDDAISEVLREFPQAKVSEIARLAVIRSGEKAKALSESKIAVVSAGTSDMRVADRPPPWTRIFRPSIFAKSASSTDNVSGSSTIFPPTLTMVSFSFMTARLVGFYDLM